MPGFDVEERCPHCGSAVHRKYDAYRRFKPAICENMCHEFFDPTDAYTASDIEVQTGWQCGPNVASHAKLSMSPKIIAQKRSRAKNILDKRKEREALAAEQRRQRLAVINQIEMDRRRYVDEALF